MHPIEHLRYVARSYGVPSAELARESAEALAGMAHDPRGLVVACRRLVARAGAAAPVWWLCARALAGDDPRRALRDAEQRLADDPTPRRVVGALPDGATAVVLGDPPLLREPLVRRGDVEVLSIDIDGRSGVLVDRLIDAGGSAADLPETSLGIAVGEADLVVLVAEALSPHGALCPAGSLAAAAVAYVSGVPVWLVSGEGRVLPGALYDAMEAAWRSGFDDPLDASLDRVSLDLLTVVVGPDGPAEPTDAAGATTCDPVPELLGDLTT